jgi:phosphoglycerol geranylgeranyltransferase
MLVYQKILDFKLQNKKGLALLLDPDEVQLTASFGELLNAVDTNADFLLIGGSHLVEDQFHSLLKEVKNRVKIPIILFPGSNDQISSAADAIFLLSLISGRNPEYLIGQHVKAAFNLKRSGLEIIPTAYLLIDGGRATTASYMSNTNPIPRDKPSIASATALAGEQLGLKCIYLDAGSGAMQEVSREMIKDVRTHCSLPLIVGGGIRGELQMKSAFDAGADIVVIGTAFEQNPELLADLGRR